MMRAMRASAKWVMGILVFAFVGWMVFDVGMGLTGQADYQVGQEIARVNGEKINAETFYGALREAQEQRRRETGAAPETLEEQRQLEDQVLDALVEQMLLRQEYQRRGIAVTDEEIRDAARNSPPPEIVTHPDFQTEGQFDLAKYQRYLSSSDAQFKMLLEARYRDELPRIKLFEQLASDIFVSDAKLWRMYRDQNDSLTGVLVALRGDGLIPDSAVRVSDADVERYYREHRDEFVSRELLPSDSAAALARVRDLRDEIGRGGDFAEVAKRESADSGTRETGGDLAMRAKGQLPPEVERAALALRPGQISEPVLSGYGYHLVRLESKKGDSLHTRHILIAVELAGDHLLQVEARADSLDRYAAEQTDPAALDTVGAQLGIPVRGAPAVRKGERAQIGRFLVPDVGTWAFEASTGEMSPVIETSNAYYVFRLDSLRQGGVPPLATIRGEVQFAATRAAKDSAVAGLAERVTQQVRTGRKLQDVATQMRLPVSTVGPFTRLSPPPVLRQAPELIGVGFGLGVGETSGPVRAGRATYFLEPTKRTLADSAAFATQMESQRLQVVQTARQARLGMLVQSLRDQANIVDQRQRIAAQQKKLAEANADVLPRR
jgi:peptidyl-prolyl cis-trans isomerase D